MGEAVGGFAYLAIVTNDNPRDEAPTQIAEALVAGLETTQAEVEVRLDRAAAIERAMTLAGEGDVVVIAGKGHEQGQIVGSGTNRRVLPFDDIAVAREIAASSARTMP